MKKIALIGSAPSSIQLAPHHDPSWDIWACSPGSYQHLKRCDAFFELHRWEPGKPWLPLEYLAFLRQCTCPVYMIEHRPEIPTSVAYPKVDMLQRFGVDFWGSTLSWMMALALAAGAEEIALYGVDMSAEEEWGDQRKDLKFFVSVARSCGVKVTLPPESDLDRPARLYGFSETDPMAIKLLVRDAELKARKTAAEQAVAAARDELMFVIGAISDNTYHMKTWVIDPDVREIIASYNKPIEIEVELEDKPKRRRRKSPAPAGNGKIPETITP